MTLPRARAARRHEAQQNPSTRLRLFRQARAALPLPPDEQTIQPATFGSMSGYSNRIGEQIKNRQATVETHPVVKAAITMRERFESVLRPEQLEAYRNKAFRNVATDALTDSRIRAEIGVTDEQSARLMNLAEGSVVSNRRVMHDQGGQMLDILTPDQQQQLRTFAAQYKMLGSIRRSDDSN